MFCPNCGTNVPANTAFCPNCGMALTVQQQPQQPQQPAYQQPVYTQPQGYPPQQVYMPQQDSGLTTAAKVFMILGTIAMGLYLIPLAWCIPMTVTYFKKVKYNLPISTGFKVCCLLFVSMLGGIFMLCDKTH